MLTVKNLLSFTRSGHNKLFSNADAVGVGWGKAFVEGKDARGYYWGIIGAAKTNAPNKKQKKWEMRFYYPKTRAKEDQYIPLKFREKGYEGPKKPPKTTQDTHVWVFCTCEYFLFACELADAERDASTLNPSWHKRRLDAYDSSGKQITRNNEKGYQAHGPNPGGVPRLCKHLIAAIQAGALTRGPK